MEFSPEFVHKVNTYEGYNFMGKYIFDRAEMTFTYAETLFNILDQRVII